MKDKLITIAACLLFLIGAVIFCYPLIMNEYYEYRTNQVLDSYKKEIEKLSMQAEKQVEDIQNIKEEGSALESSKDTEALDNLYEEMKAYNETIYENNQENLTDPFSYESSDFDLNAYGLENNIIGYLSIFAMNVELPIYLGANEENLTKGAVHLGQTSMPIGGIHTNTVLAAHRGYRGIPMFREIEKLKIGDFVTITTPWDTLTYQVCKIEIILPHEVDKILIQPGKDMLTLFTCHPYRENTHRYVVYCERSSGEESKGLAHVTETEQTSDIPVKSSDSNDSTPHTEMVEPSEGSLSSSDFQILIDKYIPLLGILFLAILLIVCIIKTRKAG